MTTPIATAPAWLSRAVRDLRCAGCGTAEASYVGVYERPGHPRLVYRVCVLCIANHQQVMLIVEKHVRQLDAIAVISCSNGVGSC
jgi:hypothetical protein